MTELDIIERLRANPLVYIGRKSLTALFHHVGGYIEGAESVGGKRIPQNITMAMNNYVREWYGITSHFNYLSILLMVGESEEAAYDTFFELLDKCLQGVDPITRE